MAMPRARAVSPIRSPESRREMSPRSAEFWRCSVSALAMARLMPAFRRSIETWTKTMPMSPAAISAIHARPRTRRSRNRASPIRATAWPRRSASGGGAAAAFPPRAGNAPAAPATPAVGAAARRPGAPPAGPDTRRAGRWAARRGAGRARCELFVVPAGGVMRWRPRSSRRRSSGGGHLELARGAHPGRAGARIGRHLAGRRRDRPARQQLGLGHATAGAHRQVRRADAPLRAGREEALHASVFKRVERNPCKPPTDAQQLPRRRQGGVELRELVVDRDADRLEHALGRMAGGEPRRRRHCADDRLDQLVRRLERPPRAVADDRARDLAGVALLPVLAEHARQLALVPAVDEVGGSELLLLIHAHVERRVVGVREA